MSCFKVDVDTPPPTENRSCRFANVKNSFGSREQFSSRIFPLQNATDATPVTDIIDPKLWTRGTRRETTSVRNFGLYARFQREFPSNATSHFIWAFIDRAEGPRVQERMLVKTLVFTRFYRALSSRYRPCNDLYSGKF